MISTELDPVSPFGKRQNSVAPVSMFKNHGRQLESSQVHLKTITKLPKVFNTNEPDIPLLFEALYQDSTAMTIFLDEMAKQDLIANRHERFLNYGKPLPPQAKPIKKLQTLVELKEKLFSNPNDTGRLIRKTSITDPNKHQFTQFGTNYKRGTFVTKLDQREYFENYIRPQNKVLFGNRRFDTSTFVIQDDQEKDDFNLRVANYLKDIERKEAQEAHREALANGNAVVDEQKTDNLPEITQAKTEQVLEK